MARVVSVESEQNLVTVLLDKGVFWDNWKKSPADLFEEIQKGESFLEEGNDGKIQRVCRVVRIKVFFEDRVLVEFFRDKKGEKNTRLLDLGASVAEKQIGNESSRDCARRALEEELKVSVLPERFRSIEQSNEVKDSLSYSGLLTDYRYFNFCITFQQHEFRTFYSEEKMGRTTYFVWIPAKLARLLWE